MNWLNELWLRWISMDTTELAWVCLGFLAQFLFMMRFIYQWIKSEQAKRSVVPEVFWYFSLGGGISLLAYSIYRMDPVYIFGQGLGLIIYLRNIALIWAEKRRLAAHPELAKKETAPS